MKQNSYYDQYPTLLHYLNTHQIESLPANWRTLQRVGHHCSAFGTIATQEQHCRSWAHPATQEQHCGKLLCIQQLSCIRCCWGASSNSAALCAVGAHPENHLPRWVPPHAPLARGSVDGTTKMAAPSTQPPSGRPSEQGRRGRCFSTCHLAAHSASLCRMLQITEVA